MYSQLRYWLGQTASRIRNVTRDGWNDGAVAAELAIALPILTLFLLGTIQYGAFFFLKGTMGDAAREAARGLAMGALTETQAVTQVEDVLTHWGSNFVVTATLPGGANPDSAVVEIRVPLVDVAFINLPGLFGDDDLSTRVAMWSEL